MTEDEELNADVDHIISQIKNQGKTLKNVEKEKPTLEKQDLEKFVIDNASTIIIDSIEMIQSLKLDVMASSDSKMVESISELVKATTSAIESLSKLKLSDDKIKAQKELKEMDIKSKENSEDRLLGNNGGLYISREDLLNRLLSSPKKDDSKIEIQDNIVDI